MRNGLIVAIVIILMTFIDRFAAAQTATNLNAFRALAPVTSLSNTSPGRSALRENFSLTAEIHNGTAKPPTLMGFPEQQQQALRDAFITSGNACNLADALGSKLGGIYRRLATYKSTDDGVTSSFTNISPAIARLIAYANGAAISNSESSKYFFANATIDGKIAGSDAAIAILKDVSGTTDIFGKAYNLPAGSKGADIYGNSRPFQTEPYTTSFAGKDFFGVQSSNDAYLRGPIQDLNDSPSYPSGHTDYGYTEGLLLAIILPERYSEMITRAAEYGNDRIILGAHYAMDVLAGRTLALYDLAQLLANKRGYVRVRRNGIMIADFRGAIAAARHDMRRALRRACHERLSACARHDTSRFADSARNRAFYEATQTYNLPVVFGDNADRSEDVAKLAPEAGYLLTMAFPYLTMREADEILTHTEGPGGGYLDDGSRFGVYSRLNLYDAVRKAIDYAPKSYLHKQVRAKHRLSGRPRG